MATAHQQVVENFIQEGRAGRGTYVVARKKDDAIFSTYDRWSNDLELPLAVRLSNGGFLANGMSVGWPRNVHQGLVLRTLESSKQPFGVVPFDSITSAWTDGKIRNWSQAPFTLKDLRQEVEIVIPSTGEKWREVRMLDGNGREVTRNVHTLGDSVIRVHDNFYVSGVDDTGRGNGTYFLAQLPMDRPPSSFEEAIDALKPKIVQDAEAEGLNVLRQGEWFSIPADVKTSQLLADVEKGIATLSENHILGRDGHHQLEEAVIYKVGPRKGEVYARGNVEHTRGEHIDVPLGVRWHRIVHNIAGASYSLVGNFD